MTKLLDQAIEKVLKLPEADQNDTAEMLLWAIQTRGGSIPLETKLPRRSTKVLPTRGG